MISLSEVEQQLIYILEGSTEGATHADLKAYTHQKLAQYTHAELSAGGGEMVPPITRIGYMISLLNGGSTDPEYLSRIEMYLSYIYHKIMGEEYPTITHCPQPQSRTEIILYCILYDIELETMGIDSTKPLSRIEDLLIRWKESFNE